MCIRDRDITPVKYENKTEVKDNITPMKHENKTEVKGDRRINRQED